MQLPRTRAPRQAGAVLKKSKFDICTEAPGRTGFVLRSVSHLHSVHRLVGLAASPIVLSTSKSLERSPSTPPPAFGESEVMSPGLFDTWDLA